MIRRIVQGDLESFYLAGISEDFQKPTPWFHVNHCLLALMNVVKCKADATPVVFQEAAKGKNVGAWSLKDAPRRCKNYQRLVDAVKVETICSMSCAADEVYQTT